MIAGPAFLGVERSLTGCRWVAPDAEVERRAEMLGQRAGLPLPLARVLAAIGIDAPEVESYLTPRLRELLPDPLRLRDIDTAATRLVTAVQEKHRIAIFADYDVDGGASAALLLDWLREQNSDAELYIPDRIDEGYGPNAVAMADLAARNDLVICVDCGTLAHDALEAAKAADVIVLDHHLAAATLPPAMAVVNPNRADEDGTLGHLCAAAVVFLTLVQAGRVLRALGTPEPNLMAKLDLVALATVADVAPLIGVNRAFVRQGLAVMARRERPGLVALSDIARLDGMPNAFHLGFLLGPRINAGGRIGRADLGALCLASRDAMDAQRLAQQLDDLNKERRIVEGNVRDQALAQVEARGDPRLSWAADHGWHPGVVGIVAARVKEATALPSVVIGIENGIGKGSARSVPGVDLGRAVHQLADEGLLIRGGGHKMAAGLTVAENRIEQAMTRLAELLAPQMAERDTTRSLPITGLIEAGAATPELLRRIEDAGPFGQGAPAPRFALANQLIDGASKMGANHLRLNFRGALGPGLEAVAWGAMDGPLGPALMGAQGRRFHLVGQLELSNWRGRERVRLRLEDAAPA